MGATRWLNDEEQFAWRMYLDGVRLLTALMGRAGSVEVRPMTSVSEGLSYESPRGTVELRDRHLRQRVFLAVADGLSWDVIQQL